MAKRNIMIPRISYSFNNGRPSSKPSSNTPYNTRSFVTIRGKQMHDTLYKQRRKLGHCYKYREKFFPCH